jgi:hypothetical protein
VWGVRGKQVLVRKTSRRERRDYEREWNGYFVDKNLEDDWLVRLNDLEAFGLISICEGHCGGQTEPSRATPHVKLRLKERFLPGIASHWDEHKMTIVSELNRLFQTGDTYLSLELKFKLRSRTGRMNYEESLTVGIHGRRARTSEEMDAETCHWFRQGVSRVEELDTLIMGLGLGTGSHG